MIALTFLLLYVTYGENIYKEDKYITLVEKKRTDTEAGAHGLKSNISIY